MVAQAHSIEIVGVSGVVVTAEADVGSGLPALVVVGRLAGALLEARERVRCAIAQSGFELRARRQVVALSPSEERKESPAADLAIAIALLCEHGIVPRDRLEGVLLWGELGLDGTLRPVRGVLVAADTAKRAGFATMIVPRAQAEQAALIEGLTVLPCDELREVVSWMTGANDLPVQPPTAWPEHGWDDDDVDLADVRGLETARRALEIMVAGGHNLLLHGPPGVGKTMLARRARGLFPALDRQAAIEVTKIHGVVRARPEHLLIDRAPLRMPHHTVSAAGLLGGGSHPRPGEVSLAHHGLLFLDELPEFSRACIEGLREPIEERAVTVVRAAGALTFPADFQLMAAMNPCPCGYQGHPERACVDNPAAVQRYQARVSGPFLDRMDLSIGIYGAGRPKPGDDVRGESTAVVRERVLEARRRAQRRLGPHGLRTNARIPAGPALLALTRLDPQAECLLSHLTEARVLSQRASQRLRRVARTCADLDGSATVTEDHVAFAAQLRALPEHLSMAA